MLPKNSDSESSEASDGDSGEGASDDEKKRGQKKDIKNQLNKKKTSLS